ncbi:MAG: indolepyruvate ferredoxin oxidoreductase family protein [Rhodobacteraceae bacterium]|nr:indolepyruvate ferredoxin oxidoreductase family protein [Paracoccaceae bacterium]
MDAPEKKAGHDALRAVSLDDKYQLASGRVYLNGTQALVRLPMLQRARDERAGLNTAGFISGYRGSPLGNVDLEFWRAKKFLEPRHIHFQAGLNEDLAATAVWGSQQVTLDRNATFDGVFAMWYGKGPGVDRSGDVFRHANAAGTAKYGGVLAIAGDDHAAKSSTLPHQTEHVFKALMMPVLAPADIQEYLELGIHGFALSRYSGCWVAFKALADTVETSASVNIDPFAVETIIPGDFPLPADGLNLRWPDPPLVQEKRLLHHKLYAALAYCRANHLNKVVIDSPNPRLGIVTSGKSYLDVRQALDDLGIDDDVAAKIGLRVYKVGMVWPLEAEGVRQFAEGLEEILVIEEKRQFLEYQLKEELYNWSESARPRVIGKFDEKGEWSLPHSEWLLPAAGELTPAMIARVIAARIAICYTSERIAARLAFLEDKEAALARPNRAIARIPHYCSGCPHNTSTRVPEGSRALAGIGCHYMATWISPESTRTFCQMGGEGVAWVGQSPFTSTRHVFANLGDGTYFHSGLLAIRQSVAAGVNITYKILYNDAVAMTGGQPHDGPLSVPIIARQIAAEGVRNIVVVTDQPEKYSGEVGLPKGTPVRHRDALDAVQRELRSVPGATAIIYDQTCAAEKRRRRKRGKYPDPARRVVINDLVCEGCGDCSEKSNCMSVVALETEFGRKRAIDQSACNKDFSCLKGFCPSFVTIEGGALKKGKAATPSEALFAQLPAPNLPATAEPWGLLVTGVGGTGVVTIGALLGMAAHLEGKGVLVLDMAGLAQKGGAVWSHVRIADRQEQLYAARIAAGEANAVIGGDLVVTASDESIAKMRAGFTRVVVNRDQSTTSDFVRGFAAQARSGDVAGHPDPQFPQDGMETRIADAVGADNADFLEASQLATAIMGDAIATNLFMLGFAWQKGLVPLSLAAILRAIEINAAAVAANTTALQWGRLAAVDMPAVLKAAQPAHLPDHHRLSTSIDELIDRRRVQLTAYQDAAYAARYLALVERVRAAEEALTPGITLLAEAVARAYYKLLAYKDEYEVARLYTNGDFLKGVEAQFEGDYKLVFHLAPPLLAGKDAVTGELRKRRYGPWMLRAMRLLARLKRLRGSRFDIFGGSAERQLDRQLIADYEALIDAVLAGLKAGNHDVAVELAGLPEQMRGFGHVRERYVAHARLQQQVLLARFNGQNAPAGGQTLHHMPTSKAPA